MRPNSIKGNELYLRCIYCGDSQKNKNHAHLSINLTTGMYYCFRCHVKGRVTRQMLLDLQLNTHLGDEINIDYGTGSGDFPTIIKGPGTQRTSALERWHTEDGSDIFFSYWRNAHVGYYLRSPHMKRLWGFSGINWHGAPDEELYSTPEDPLYLVEGPYDVQTASDVCFFGIPTFKKIQAMFREHFFILKPDGDVWTDPVRFAIIRSLINTLIQKNFGLLGVEFLPKAFDPDDHPQSKLIPTQYFKEKLWQSTSLSSKVQQDLASLH